MDRAEKAARAREATRRWRLKNPNYVEPNRRNNANRAARAWRNGMTVAEMDAFFATHDYRCDICLTPWNDSKPGGGLTIDHDHSCCGSQAPNVPCEDRPRQLCGKCHRGLLCYACNTAMGHLGEPARLARAISYLAGTLSSDLVGS